MLISRFPSRPAYGHKLAVINEQAGTPSSITGS